MTDITQRNFLAKMSTPRGRRFVASIVAISCGTGLIIGTAISQSSLILLLGWALTAAGYSLNIGVQREIAKELP